MPSLLAALASYLQLHLPTSVVPRTPETAIKAATHAGLRSTYPVQNFFAMREEQELQLLNILWDVCTLKVLGSGADTLYDRL